MPPLPKELLTVGEPGDQILVRFPSAAACSVTRMRTDANGRPVPGIKYGTWRTSANGLSLVFAGQVADYEWREEGLNVEGREHRLWQLVPKFADPIGPLPALPLLDVEVVAKLLAASAAPRPRGIVGWLMILVLRSLMPLPWWLRAPVATAIMLDLIVLVRFAAQMNSSTPVEGLGTTLASVAAAGVVGGGVPTLLFVPLRRLGYFGSLLNGVVAALSYLLACSWAFDKPPADQRSWWIFLGVGTFSGLVVGHAILHPLAKPRAAKGGGEGA